MNKGTFKGDTYYKNVTFSKAVLWKDRQISLPPFIVKQFKPKGIKWVEFEDRDKGEKWRVKTDTLRKNFEVKKVGQETQYYFPIGIFEVIITRPPTPKPKKERKKRECTHYLEDTLVPNLRKCRLCKAIVKDGRRTNDTEPA